MLQPLPPRKINYVCCCWSGPRRNPDPRYATDPTFYLREHLRSLQCYKHRLAQITLAVAHNAQELPAYRQLLQSVNKIQDTPVTILDRPNLAMSYGSFADAYAKYRLNFNYYFFVEDDYIYTLDHFDDIHAEVLEQNPRCGQICGLAQKTKIFPMHAAISNGLYRSPALEKIFSIPLVLTGKNDYHVAECNQIKISQDLIRAGYHLLDWRGQYKVGFRRKDMSVEFYHQPHLIPICMPV